MTNELSPIPRPHFLPAIESVDLVGAFLGGRNPRTLRAYDRDLEDFARFLGCETSRQAMNLLTSGSHGQANAIALAYRTHLTERGLKTATIGRRLAALRSIVKLARTLGVVPWTLEVDAPRVEAYRDTIACGSPGWRSMLELAKTEAATGNPKATRDLAIIRCLHDIGLRRGEAVATDVGSLDLERGTLAIVGKGKTEAKKLTLPDPTRDSLARWLELRGSEPGPLFVRLDRAAIVTGRLSGESVRLLVADLAARAGVSGPVRPHGLRHLAVTAVLDRNGGDIRAAQDFARHSDPKTTMRYDRNRRDLAGSMAKLIADE
jgi:integrase/recombinase XerC